MEKYQDFEERDWKIEIEIEKSRACSDRSPWKCHKTIKLQIINNVAVMQKMALLATARILRKVMEI